MNNLLSQKWCVCLNVQNRIKLCRAKNHKFGDNTTVYITYIYTRQYIIIYNAHQNLKIVKFIR